MKLTVAKLDHMLWWANRRSRADGAHMRMVKSGRQGQWPHVDSLENNLMNEMRPHLVMILRLARKQLERRR